MSRVRIVLKRRKLNLGGLLDEPETMQLTLEQKIFNLLTQIPKGKVTTYKLLAQAAGVSNPRQIGTILHGNKNPHKFPCYKVIRSDGTIAEGYAYGGYKEQIKKLEEDGVICKNGKVDIKVYKYAFKK